MTPLRERMLHDMRIRNLADNTQKSYLQQVSSFARHFRCSPRRRRSAAVGGCRWRRDGCSGPDSRAPAGRRRTAVLHRLSSQPAQWAPAMRRRLGRHRAARAGCKKATHWRRQRRDATVRGTGAGTAARGPERAGRSRDGRRSSARRRARCRHPAGAAGPYTG